MGVAIGLKFKVTQETRDLEVLKNLAKYLGCGRIELDSKRSIGHFVVVKYSDIVEKVIPLFHNHLLIGNKAKDFEDFCKVASLMKSKAHLTQEGLEKISEIKAGMNRGRE